MSDKIISRLIKSLFSGLMLCCLTATVQAQNTFKAIVSNAETAYPLSGATVKWNEQGKNVVADNTGLIILNDISNGRQTFLITHIGFKEKTVSFKFPMEHTQPIEIKMEEAEEEEEEAVVVTATRTSRTIANTPTR